MDLATLPSKPGYFWADFDFTPQKLLLTPDRYWIVLKWRGDPIVNWFYSYGKPVGPVDGTRYRKKGVGRFTGNLSYEFNYRVTGQTPE